MGSLGDTGAENRVFTTLHMVHLQNGSHWVTAVLKIKVFTTLHTVHLQNGSAPSSLPSPSWSKTT